MKLTAIKISFIALLSWSAVAIAETELPIMPTPKDSGVKFLLEDQVIDENGLEQVEILRRFSIWLSAGPSFSSYNLETNSQNNIKLPMTRGFSKGFGAAYRMSASDQLKISGRKSETEFSAISGVSTTPLNVQELEARLGYLSSIGGGFFLNSSYRYHDREVREIIPVAVMTGSIAHGIHLEIGWEKFQENSWSILMRAGLFTPIFFKEKFQETGKSRIRLYSDAGMQLKYDLGGGFEIGIAPSISIEYRSYSGALNRAVQDAKERWIEFVAPLQVNASF